MAGIDLKRDDLSTRRFELLKSKYKETEKII